MRAAELATRVAHALPCPGERVAVTGCGSSLYMATAYAVLRERAGHGHTDAFAASEEPTHRRYDRVLALTRSGTTTEVLDLLARLRGTVPTTAVTADPTAAVAGPADAVVGLEFADERSVVATRSSTSMLALLRAHLGTDLAPIAEQARAVLRRPLDGLEHAGQVTFLGTGWTVGLAYEAALKLREAAGAWTEAYPAMEYRHGPISIAEPGRVVWVFGAVPPGLAGDVAATGARLVADDSVDPMALLPLAHRVAAAMAAIRGLDPDRPRNLSRSVVLTTGGRPDCPS
ncbi:MAG TPA: sugar isomerase [Pseudonocardiaceae bacterium]